MLQYRTIQIGGRVVCLALGLSLFSPNCYTLATVFLCLGRFGFHLSISCVLTANMVVLRKFFLQQFFIFRIASAVLLPGHRLRRGHQRGCRGGKKTISDKSRSPSPASFSFPPGPVAVSSSTTAENRHPAASGSQECQHENQDDDGGNAEVLTTSSGSATWPPAESTTTTTAVASSCTSPFWPGPVAASSSPTAAGAEMRHDHAQRTEVVVTSVPRTTVVASCGSIGHPFACSRPGCKYVLKAGGCKDGALCERCHFCPWKETHSEKRNREKRNRWQKTEFCPYSTRKDFEAGAFRAAKRWKDQQPGLAKMAFKNQLQEFTPARWANTAGPGPQTFISDAQHGLPDELERDEASPVDANHEVSSAEAAAAATDHAPAEEDHNYDQKQPRPLHRHWKNATMKPLGVATAARGVYPEPEAGDVLLRLLCAAEPATPAESERADHEGEEEDNKDQFLKVPVGSVLLRAAEEELRNGFAKLRVVTGSEEEDPYAPLDVGEVAARYFGGRRVWRGLPYVGNKNSWHQPRSDECSTWGSGRLPTAADQRKAFALDLSSIGLLQKNGAACGSIMSHNMMEDLD